jgi:hypothetical protein
LAWLPIRLLRSKPNSERFHVNWHSLYPFV